ERMRPEERYARMAIARARPERHRRGVSDVLQADHSVVSPGSYVFRWLQARSRTDDAETGAVGCGNPGARVPGGRYPIREPVPLDRRSDRHRSLARAPGDDADGHGVSRASAEPIADREAAVEPGFARGQSVGRRAIRFCFPAAV